MLRIKNFNINAFGHGGERRSAQINEIFKEVSITDLDVNELHSNNLKNFFTLLTASKKTRSLIKEYQDSFFYKQRLKQILRIENVFKTLKNSTELSAAKNVIWESTNDTQWFLSNILKTVYKKKVFAFPHNLESIVPFQETKVFKSNFYWFKEEIGFLKCCDHVFTISQEEEWLLQTVGVNATYLPYYPANEVEMFLDEVRNKRESQNQENLILIIGTVGNPPTYTGVKNLLDFISNTSWGTLNQFVVVGYGTEVFHKFKYSNFIKILGTVSSNELLELMVKTKALLINQVSSSGVLTKIMEFLIAGIPIIANDASARSYRNIDGITTFTAFNELNEIILSNFTFPIKPEKPVATYKKVLEIVNDSN